LRHENDVLTYDILDTTKSKLNKLDHWRFKNAQSAFLHV
jgi:hypothetical protein